MKSAEHRRTAATVAVTANTTACTLVVTATLNGYNSATAEVSVNLEEGVLVFSTTPAPAYAGRGFATSGTTEIGDIPASDDNGVAVTWSFTAAGTRSGSTQTNVCSVDNNSSSATFGDITAGTDAQDGDECTITMTATASVAGYATWSRDVTLEAGFIGVVEIAAGNNFYCARFDNGKAKCWGNGPYLGSGGSSNLGDGAGEMGSSLPYLSVGTDTVIGMPKNGRAHSCAILSGGTVKCWGNNRWGQLGTGSFINRDYYTPQAAVNFGSSNGVALTVVQMDSGEEHSCAVLDNGSLKCWGRNIYGQLGIGNKTNQHTPQLVNLGTDKTAKQVTAGFRHTCAILNDDTVKCWGWGAYGVLGYGSDDSDRNTPPATTLNFGEDDEEQPKTAKHIAAGSYHSCAILNDDSLVCWGGNSYGEVGGGNTSNGQYSPQVVNLGQKTAKYVAGGESATCAILNDDSLVCWGRNRFGQLGYGDTTQRTSPPTTAVDLGTGRTVRQVALGKDYDSQNVCALLDNGRVKCWGRHKNGSLGAGSGTFNWGDGNNRDGESEMGDNLPVVELL